MAAAATLCTAAASHVPAAQHAALSLVHPLRSCQAKTEEVPEGEVVVSEAVLERCLDDVRRVLAALPTRPSFLQRALRPGKVGGLLFLIVLTRPPCSIG